MHLKNGISSDRLARQTEEKDRAVEVIRQAIASLETAGRQPTPWEKVVLADAISGAWRGWYSSVAAVVREMATPPTKGCHPSEPMLENTISPASEGHWTLSTPGRQQFLPSSLSHDRAPLPAAMDRRDDSRWGRRCVTPKGRRSPLSIPAEARLTRSPRGCSPRTRHVASPAT